MKTKDHTLAALLSPDAPCDRYACPARARCAAEHGMAYKSLKLPADKAAWAWAEFKVVPA